LSGNISFSIDGNILAPIREYCAGYWAYEAGQHRWISYGGSEQYEEAMAMLAQHRSDFWPWRTVRMSLDQLGSAAQISFA